MTFFSPPKVDLYKYTLLESLGKYVSTGNFRAKMAKKKKKKKRLIREGETEKDGAVLIAGIPGH